MSGYWQQIQTINSKSYECSCGNQVASEKGWHTIMNPHWYIYVCPMCNKPTLFKPGEEQVPGNRFGKTITDISDSDVANLYEEARDSFSVNAFTNVVLACRKLLMHIAVAQGAEEGKNFTEYVQYLADQHIIPATSIDWVDHIRQKGNEANHEIKIMTRTEAENLLTFSAMLLQMIYEFPARLPTSAP